jgi:hypothetical protein
LLPFEYLRETWDLASLSGLFIRPSDPQDFDPYGMSLDPYSLRRLPNSKTPETGGDLSQSLIDCVYFRSCDGKLPGSQEVLGAEAIKLWSQQWPKLRQSFRFRTIGKPSFGRSPLLAFDLGVFDGELRFTSAFPDPMVVSHPRRGSGVQTDLALDLNSEQPTKVRQFIHLYGDDLPLRPEWIPFLAWVRRTAMEVTAGETDAILFVDAIAKALPAKEDGLRLKTDLLSFNGESPTSLPVSAFPSVMEYLFQSDRTDSFPPLKESVFQLIVDLWEKSPQRALKLIASAPDRDNTSTASHLIDALVRVPDQTSLMNETSSWPTLRLALVKRNPYLLRWDGLIRIDDSELIALLEVVTNEVADQVGVTQRLIATSSFAVAKYLCDRFPTEILRDVCVGRGYLGHAFVANDFLLRRAGEIARQYLSETFLQELRTTSSLYSFASMLGFINGHTVNVGPLPWAHSLHNASVDTDESDTQILRAFLLALSLARPQKGAESLFEYGFEALHQAMKSSSLPYQASVLLDGQLPDVSWWRRWDSCERLRIAVANAYVREDLSPASFPKLAKDPHLMGQMFQTLESDYHARGYLERVRLAMTGHA